MTTTTIHDDEICAPPTERVPIFIEITRHDTELADRYCSNGNCIVATALKRMGYGEVSVGGSYLDIGRHRYENEDDLHARNLCGNHDGPKGYAKNIIGKQIIIYPV